MAIATEASSSTAAESAAEKTNRISDALERPLAKDAQQMNAEKEGTARKEAHDPSEEQRTAGSKTTPREAAAPGTKDARQSAPLETEPETQDQLDRRTLARRNLEEHFTQHGKHYRFRANETAIAFTEDGKQLVTKHESDVVVRGMVNAAETKGWKVLNVQGTEEFQQKVWLEASAQGLDVRGYIPNDYDIRMLAERRANKMERVDLPTARQVDTPPVERPETNAPSRAAPPAPAFEKVVAMGSAPYKFDKDEAKSFYVTLEGTKGNERTVWGKDLERATREAGVNIGDEVRLQLGDKKPVTVSANVRDAEGRVVGKEEIPAKLNTWNVEKREVTQQVVVETTGRNGAADVSSAERAARTESPSPIQRSSEEVSSLNSTIDRSSHLGIDSTQLKASLQETMTRDEAIKALEAAIRIKGNEVPKAGAKPMGLEAADYAAKADLADLKAINHATLRSEALQTIGANAQAQNSYAQALQAADPATAKLTSAAIIAPASHSYSLGQVHKDIEEDKSFGRTAGAGVRQEGTAARNEKDADLKAVRAIEERASELSAITVNGLGKADARAAVRDDRADFDHIHSSALKARAAVAIGHNADEQRSYRNELSAADPSLLARAEHTSGPIAVSTKTDKNKEVVMATLERVVENKELSPTVAELVMAEGSRVYDARVLQGRVPIVQVLDVNAPRQGVQPQRAPEVTIEREMTMGGR